MALRVGRNRDLEVAKFLDAAHQVGGVAVAVGMWVETRADAARRIAAQRHDVADSSGGEILHHRVDLCL